APAGLPAVHPFAAIGVLVLLPHRCGVADEVFLLGEELVVACDRRTAECIGREIGKREEGRRAVGVGHTSVPRSVAVTVPRAAISSPRRYVAWTAPRNSSPAYGVTRWR